MTIIDYNIEYDNASYQYLKILEINSFNFFCNPTYLKSVACRQ